jgi:tetratricopeptide (TPR) repeat protein
LISFIALSGFLSANACAADADINKQLNACNKAMSAGDAAAALDIANKVLADDKDNRVALLCKGRALDGLGQYTESLVALNAAELSSQTSLDHIVALTLIGNVQRDTKQYAEAQSTYEKSLALTRTDKNTHFERIDLNLIGDILVLSNQPEQGLDSYLAASKLAANDNERAEGFEKIAHTYQLIKNYDKAIEYQIKAYLMQEQSGDLDDYANAGLELGAIYTAAGNYVNAEKYINKTLKLSRDNGGAYWEAKSEYYLALNKIASQKSADARPLLLDAQKISSDIGAKGLDEQISSTLNTLPK